MLLWLWWGFMLNNSIINITLWNKNRDKLAFFYIFTNAYRSTFLVVHSTNTCIFTICSPFIERTLSTIAEIAFTHQIINYFKLTDNFNLCMISNIYMAEIYCWLGIITGESKYHVMEETIWCCNAVFLFLWINYINKDLIIPKKILINNILIIYIAYMCIYDIPYYIHREDVNKKQLFFCEILSSNIDDYKSSLIWMTGYFTVGSWISLSLR